ncbi:zinc finger protein 862-like [Mytilus edulis]|uniref:zinc finger protein 862-like n=1 Tax=Mytilus edulis TaxID=6550 RepID=UPI0039EEFE31
MGKIVAMGTDGAAVMIGKSSGVVRKIAEETQRPFVRAIHCSAHRLELAAKDAGKEVNMAKKCDLLMLNLYLFYRYSPLNRSNLKIAFRSMDKKIKIPTRVGGTRWLPHTEKALKTLLSSYDAIVCHLEQMQATPSDFRKESSAKGRWFLKLLKNKGVVQWLHFLMDVIKCLSKVSKTIQTKESTLADIFNELESAKVILNKYLTRLW